MNLILVLYFFVAFEKEIKNKKRLLSTRYIDELDKKQDDLTKMLILNGILYFISHFPELISSVFLIVFSKKLVNFCEYKYSCDLINENAQFLPLSRVNYAENISIVGLGLSVNPLV